MMDPQSRAVLQALIQRESQSLLHYVCESFPWITAREQEALDRLQQINKEEMESAAVLARYLFKHHIVPAALGSYPMTYTNINYMALDHLMPLLITYQQGQVGELEKDLRKIKDAEARQHVEQFLDMKRRHLGTLEELAQSLVEARPAISSPS
jgi:hypothetical protein